MSIPENNGKLRKQISILVIACDVLHTHLLGIRWIVWQALLESAVIPLLRLILVAVTSWTYLVDG